MKRGYLAIGAAVVLAAVIGLYVLLRTEDDVAANRAPVGASGSTPGRTPTAEPDRGKPDVPMPETAPRDTSQPVAHAGSGSVVSEYTIGGIRVRDHRSGDHTPLDIPPAIHAPNGRKIPSQLTSVVAQRLRTVVAECAGNIPPDARGASPHLDGQVMIAIKSQQATITSAIYQARDVTGAAQGLIKQCMEEKSVGVAVPAGDEPDVEGYAITLSLRLP
jgi:hypothetical protein